MKIDVIQQLKTAEEIIDNLYENSTCDDPLNRKVDRMHAHHTREWVLKLEPNADIALQIAALGHDIDRTDEKRRIKKENFNDYDEYKRLHAIESADILCEALLKGNLGRDIIEKVRHLVTNHEVGGDKETDILRDADSLSFFNSEIYEYFKYRGSEKTKQKIAFMYERLAKRVRDEVKKLKIDDEIIQKIVKEVINEINKGE